jgi:hypothetical protein
MLTVGADAGWVQAAVVPSQVCTVMALAGNEDTLQLVLLSPGTRPVTFQFKVTALPFFTRLTAVMLPEISGEIVGVLMTGLTKQAEPFQSPVVQVHVVPTVVTPDGSGFWMPVNGALVQRSGSFTTAVAVLWPVALVPLSV